MRAILILCSLVVPISGCSTEAVTPTDPAPLIQPVLRVPGASTPVQLSAIAQRYDLTGSSGAPLGVTIDPDTGRRLVLTNDNALHDLDALGEPPLWSGAPLTDPTALFTDVAALGDHRFALTSWSDGYVLDLSTGELALHFCYEPGWWEPTGNDPIQLSFGVAHDANAELIYAQPRTMDEGGLGPTTENFVASYDEATGADLDWWAIEELDFSAGGIAVLPTEEGAATRLVMGQGSELFVFDTDASSMTPVASLGSAEVIDVAGLAIDREAGTLLVADPGAMQVVEIRLDALGL